MRADNKPTVNNSGRGCTRKQNQGSYILDDHDQKRQLDAQCLFLLTWACDESGRHVRSHDLEHRALDVCVGDSFDVPVPDIFAIPYLQRF